MKEIVISLIGAVIPAIATIFTVLISNQKSNALQDERDKSMKAELEKLTQKVEQHNNFGLQLARLETRVDILEKRA